MDFQSRHCKCVQLTDREFFRPNQLTVIYTTLHLCPSCLSLMLSPALCSSHCELYHISVCEAHGVTLYGSLLNDCFIDAYEYT